MSGTSTDQEKTPMRATIIAKRRYLAGVVLCLTATSALAQVGPLPNAGGSGGRAGGSAPAPVLGADGQPLVESPMPLTEAQKLAASLPPPQMGFGGEGNPLPADTPMPGSDPRDLQGTWFHNQPLGFRIQNDMYGRPLPYTMAGAKVLERRVIALNQGKPVSNASALCRPPGPQWQHDLNMPFQIFQSKDWIEFVFLEYHGRWQIVMNPAAAPKPAQKQYMGYSVGHWEGNTLVVETTDFRQGMHLDVDGTPFSRNGKMIHRIRKVDNGDRRPFMEVETTFIDPLYYTHPWTVVRTWGWKPSHAAFREYNCEEQVGDPNVGPDEGLVKEPAD
jgi:hypothetical protein